MFLIGIIAIPQMTILPGLLVLQCFPDDEGNVLESIFYTFAPSLMANAAAALRHSS
jgi:hypothetical protein